MKFLKATIVGGLLFLVPVVLIIVVLGHAMRLAVKVAQPISESLQLDNVGGLWKVMPVYEIGRAHV